jgi:S1-C subfamily serine protease
MQPDLGRPRVSRETRRLFTAAVLALLTLWILARLRFPDGRVGPNPVAPVLTQIAVPTTFADLASEIDTVRRRIAPLLVEVPQTLEQSGDSRIYPAWPWRDDVAIVILPAGSSGEGVRTLAVDPPTGLALVQTGTPAAPVRSTWIPDSLAPARYFFAAVPGPSGPTVAPAYVGSLEPLRSPAWSIDIWRVPAAARLAAGALLFTAAGEWLGIAAEENGEQVIVPAAAVEERAAQLNSQRGRRPSDLGVQVQRLSPSLSRATGTTSGVIVTWVDPQGRAAETLVVGDVVERLNTADILSPFAWQVHSTRLAVGETAMLRVRRAGAVIDVALPPAASTARPGGLGLTLAREAGAGARVVRVVPGAAADRAGLQAGDVVTMMGEYHAPTPAQVRRAFDTAAEGSTVLCALARGSQHLVVTLAR